MASCQTKQWADGANYVKLTVTVDSGTATTAVLAWTLQYITTYPPTTSYAKEYTVKIAGDTVKTGTYDINGKNGTYTIASGTKTITKTTSEQNISFSVSFGFLMTWSGVYAGTLSASGSIAVSAKTSYNVKYNANGGSGAPGDQTKWYGTNITLSTTKPTRTGYTFQGWGTSTTDASVDYAAGATYSSNAGITLYAIWKAHTYVVSYNANGGSGAPGNQTKTYGVNLTLSSTKPTRTNYTFQGWGASAAATTVSYASGASYTKNAAITLYAIWKLSYKIPRISSVTAVRCNSSGISDEEGTYALVTFNWATDKTVSTITITCNGTTTTVTASGTNGTVDKVIGAGLLDTDTSYDISITVSDASGSFNYNKSLTGSFRTYDLLAGGRGISLGKTAEMNNYVDVNLYGYFRKPVHGTVEGLDWLPAIPTSSNFNDYINIGCWSVQSNADAETIINIPVARAGRLIVRSGTGEGIRSAGYSYLRQTYKPYNIENPTWERDVTRDGNNVWTFGPWYRTSLSKGVTDLVYHTQKALWSGTRYMTADHTNTLSEPISDQPNGIVLTFSKYADGAALDNNYNHFFVPKEFVATLPGRGSGFTMMDINFGQICHKYLYINDTTITGHANNSASGTGGSGIKYDNSKYVLRYVWGV